MSKNPKPVKLNKSHGDGNFKRSSLPHAGKNIVIEKGVLIFHSENVEIGNNVYVGHNSILKGYYKNRLVIGDNTWIGQGCFFHSAAGLRIGRDVGIGPNVIILTSQHTGDDIKKPVLFTDIKFQPVSIGDGSDIGAGAIILPGVTIGAGAIIGAGAVVTKDVPAHEIWAGNPAKLLRKR
jgi:acetyltransferase-like isoleucine patch superfamily enzyme